MQSGATALGARKTSSETFFRAFDRLWLVSSISTKELDTDMPAIEGLHHVTAIAGEPQTNINFYTGVLGLRLVKRTVNFDDPTTYHLYYGDGQGHPGTIMTFFPWRVPPRRANPHSLAKYYEANAATWIVFIFDCFSKQTGERCFSLALNYLP